MLWLRVILLALLSAFNNEIIAEPAFFWDADSKNAHQEISRFDLKTAATYIESARKNSPANLIPDYLESKADFLSISFTENEEAYRKWQLAHEVRLKNISTAGNSAEREFYEAELRLHAAMIKLRFGNYFSAGIDIRRAYRGLERGISLNPDFLPQYRSWFMLKAAIGSLPSQYSLFLSLIGLDGELIASINALDSIADKLKSENSVFAKETQIYQSFAHYYLMNDMEKARQILDSSSRDYKNNPLSAFLRASFLAKDKKNDEVLRVLSHHIKTETLIPQIEFMYATALLYKLDSRARIHFVNYLESYSGLNQIKDTYLKLGWSFLVSGDTVNYNRSIYLARVKGVARFGKDKQAYLEANREFMPNPALLSTRLLFDGGYYEEALKKLNSLNPNDLIVEYQAEFFYRQARVHHAIGDMENAISYYQAYLNRFDLPEEYYGAASALALAEIYESRENYTSSSEHFKLVLEMKHHPYNSIFEQRAKSGLKRIEAATK